MATANFLTVKTHLTEFRSNSDKDSISEASESGTTNSVTSAEELQKFALILGLNSAEDVYQERFRIDRRRLEGMLADTLEETQTAQAFFHRVMTETNTLIKWPTRLKIGARSKKDPHVRVAGRPESVKMAREKIMQLLDTRSNRVTMKIDVSYTDHSHIIGKGGLTIKRVMEETGCHIHFPDSNRTSTVEKSNQVSIAGDMERVERARARVRALTPLVFSFELPVSSSSQPLPDLNSSYVQQIQEQYNVQVMLRNRPKLHANLLVVKGVQWEVQSTMEATSLLMSFMCGSLVSQTQVQMTLEISPMHHPVVAGRGAEQLKIIMQGTNTQIMFPDADDPNIPMIKKSSVTITGQIDNVYNARQQLVGSLPLVVIFDVSEEACRFDADAVTRLMHKHNVYVNIRRKPKQGIASVVIKGIERCAGDIYEARRELLGGTEPAIAAEIPESYTIPAITTNSIPNFSTFNPFSPTHATNMPNINSPNMASPYNVTLADLASYANMASPMFGQHPPTPGGYPSPHSPAGPVFPPTWIIRSPQPRAGQFAYPSSGQQANKFAKQASWNPMSNGGDAAVNKMQPPIMVQASYQPSETRPTPATLSQILNSSSQASSGYQSNFTGSSVSLDTNNISGGESSNMVSPSVSPISKTHSPAPSSENERSQHELANIIHELPLSERRAVGCEKKTLETLNKLSPLSDYRRLKAEANMAMQESVGNGYRVPNTRWSGHYFSHTSPNPLNAKHPNNEMVTPPKHWQRAELSRPQIQSPAPAPAPGPGPSHSLPGPSHSPPGAVRPPRSADKPCRYTQLHELLRQLGLNKYIDLFKEHELDMSTFASLCEADLAEIGVTAFGARRKMLLVIAELQKQGSGFKTSNSPRAERKLFNSPKYNTDAISEKDKW